jgi:hypothetical protein
MTFLHKHTNPQGENMYLWRDLNLGDGNNNIHALPTIQTHVDKKFVINYLF